MLIVVAAALASASLTVRVVDDDANATIPAQVIAWENYYWTGFHGSGDTCFRAAGIRAEPPQSNLSLPEVPPEIAKRFEGLPRHAESLAFARGYCAVAPNAVAGFADSSAPGGFVFMGGDRKGLQSLSLATIHTRASREPAEYRLLYLASLARIVKSTCFDVRDREFMEGMIGEIVAEADSLPKTFHERFLAQRVHDALGSGRESSIYKPFHGFVTEHASDMDALRRKLESAPTTPFHAAWCSDGHCAAGAPPRDMMVSANPYDVDLRDEQGRTALMRAASEVNPSAIRLLLSFGADPNVVTRPGGFDALDLLLFRAEKDVGANAPDGVELHLMRALDALIAAHSSLHPAHRQLLAHPEAWRLDPRAYAFWTAVAEKVSSLPARDPFSPVCSTPELHLTTLGLGSGGKLAQASRSPAREGADHATFRSEEAAAIRVYEEMRENLKGGDIEGALSHFTDAGKANQRRIFEQLGRGLANAAENLGRIVEVQAGPHTAEITLERDTPQGKRAFRVMMVRSYDGKEWKIDSM